MHVGLRWQLQVEVVVPVDPTHQHGAFPRRVELPHVGRDVADGETHPAVVGRVGLRPVEDQHMVQRHLAGPQHHRHHIFRLDADLDLLPA